MRDFYLVVTILEAIPSDFISEGLPVAIYQWSAPKRVREIDHNYPILLPQTIPIYEGISTDPYLLDLHLQADNSFRPYAFSLYMFRDNTSTKYFERLKIKIDIYYHRPKKGDEPIKSLIETVQGNAVVFILPSYNILDNDEQQKMYRSDEYLIIVKH